MFVTVERRSLILKLVIREVVLLNLKQKNRLSQQRECVYIAQLRKEMRLLYESLFIPIERQTSILKMVEREVFLLNPKQQNRLSQQGECVYIAQS